MAAFHSNGRPPLADRGSARQRTVLADQDQVVPTDVQQLLPVLPDQARGGRKKGGPEGEGILWCQREDGIT